MAKGIVIYYSRSGNTKQMAEMITKAMGDGGLETDCKEIAKVKVDDLLKYDAIVVGSPTYYGGMAAQIKQLIDDGWSSMGSWTARLERPLPVPPTSAAAMRPRLWVSCRRC
jgi:NAD(P)H dehydrogenase (quinone)